MRAQPLADSLAYSESEQLQFSHPPRESRGPLDLSPEVAKINEASEVDMEDK